MAFPTSVPERDLADDDRPPSTPWGLWVLLFSFLGAWSFAFKVWDESEFPETFWHPAYWVGVGILLTLFFLVALRLRRPGSASDLLLTAALAMSALLAFGGAIYVVREAKPSDDTFTVIVYDFSGDGSAMKDAVDRFHGVLVDELAKVKVQSGGKFDFVERPREIQKKGENRDERIAYALKWARRRRGGHLALWVKLGADKTNSQLVGTAFLSKVQPFGSEVNDEVLGNFGTFDLPFTSPQGTPGVSAATADDVLQSVEFYWGLASYRKEDYGSAVRELKPLRLDHARYYAGRSALGLATKGQDVRQSLQAAEDYLRDAINYHGEEQDRILGLYYEELAEVFFARAVTAVDDPVRNSDFAAQMYEHAAEIYAAKGMERARASAMVGEAKDLINEESFLSNVSDSDKEQQHILERADKLLGEAAPNLTPEDAADADTCRATADYNLSTHVPRARASALVADSIGLSRRALDYYQRSSSPRMTPNALRLLGSAEIREAILQAGDRPLTKEDEYERGMKHLAEGAEECRRIHLSSQSFLIHKMAAALTMSWAGLWPTGSDHWTEALERAENEWLAAIASLSKNDQAGLYSWAERELADAYQAEALSSDYDKEIGLLHKAEGELTDALGSLSVQGCDASEIYLKRAECFRRLADYSQGPDRDESYRVREGQDKAAAKKSAKLRKCPSY